MAFCRKSSYVLCILLETWHQVPHQSMGDSSRQSLAPSAKLAAVLESCSSGDLQTLKTLQITKKKHHLTTIETTNTIGPVPGVGVAIFIAGVPRGVFPGVSRGVEEPIWLAGVSSHLDFRLLAPGVGVSPTDSSPLSVRGVSAQPLPWPGVSETHKLKLFKITAH